jgi:hypothetical protein
MKKFEYRAPRFGVDLPARFSVGNQPMVGRCREISRDGMIFEFVEPLALNAQGTIAVTFHERTIELKARVAHVDGFRSGLAFLYDSESERTAVAHLVATLPSVQNRPGPVLLS